MDIPRAIYNLRFFAGAVLYQTERCDLDEWWLRTLFSRTSTGCCLFVVQNFRAGDDSGHQLCPAHAAGRGGADYAVELAAVPAYMEGQ